ncbi:DUF5722 domain-containing protein [Planctomycetota bacterium]
MNTILLLRKKRNRTPRCLLLFLCIAFCNSSELIAESRYVEEFPSAASKKGLQVEIIDDAIALGVKHAAINVNLSQIVVPAGTSGGPSWKSGGATFHFNASALRRLDEQIKPLSDRGVIVNLIILAYQSGNKEVDRLMLHPEYDPAAPNRLGAFNCSTQEGRKWFVATLEFLAERWSRPDRRFGRAVGFIIGNEVNSHWWWCNRGKVAFEEFATDYLRTVRLAHGAIRGQSSCARVYLSLEHHWNIRYGGGDERQSFAGRRLIDYIGEKGADFDWHLAYHPYPEDLFEPRFWNDKTANHSVDTPRITFKNLEVLTDYFSRDELFYDGKRRRIILSEQGFHTPDGADGEAIQAAAYCYAYRRVAMIDSIDSLILHRHVDDPHEGGLQLGLRRRDGKTRPKKRIYECFRRADQEDWRDAFSFALPIIGLDAWPAD